MLFTKNRMNGNLQKIRWSFTKNKMNGNLQKIRWSFTKKYDGHLQKIR